jgi:L,D-transpeptidase YcbB
VGGGSPVSIGEAVGSRQRVVELFREDCTAMKSSRCPRTSPCTFRALGIGLAAVVAWTATIALPTSGLGQSRDPVFQFLGGKATEWSDGFDAASTGAEDVRTSTPILSPEIVSAVQVAIAQYSDIVARGGWPVVPAGKVLRLGVRDPAVVTLRQRLAITGDLERTAGLSATFDSYVDAAVRRFQARHGIPVDGVVGESTLSAMNVPAGVRLSQLATNLARLKSLTTSLPDRFVVVNIPGAAVEAVENGRVVSRHTAVVGKVDRPSPIVNSKIHEINFNPFWTVPESIIRKDLIPLMQEDPQYLTKQRIRIYDPAGNPLAPEQVNWYTDEAAKFLFRQDPGDFNSLGLVKINFPSPDGVYMHDTPNKDLFNTESRFYSSGCVRIQGIRSLISWLLRDSAEWPISRIEEQYRSGERVDARLAHPVQLYWTYITAWAATEGVVQFRNDIYNLDGLDVYVAQQAGVPL